MRNIESIKERVEKAKLDTKTILDKIYEVFPHKINYIMEWEVVNLILIQVLGCTSKEASEGSKLFIQEHNNKFQEVDCE